MLEWVEFSSLIEPDSQLYTLLSYYEYHMFSHIDANDESADYNSDNNDSPLFFPAIFIS